MYDLLDGLNSEQHQAVTSTAPVILCLAGAGSGKTTVLTRRVANLHINHRVGTTNMLCLTFTRLAGKEMKERIIKLVGEQEGKKLFVNTFHSFAVSVLRRWGHKLEIDDNFTIYDQEDREEIIRKIIEEFGGKVSLKKVMDRQVVCKDINEERKLYPEECRVLIEYGYRCKQNNAVDLDRLIDLVVRLWNICPESLAEYRQNFTHIFVDEYQDTNEEQAIMLDMLQTPNVFLVGDDFQAIYGWRGAEVKYILDFKRNNPECEIIKLEDNYRSTEQIVAVANRVIKYNVNQTEKTLRAHKNGIEVVAFRAKDSNSEAANIAEFSKVLNNTIGVPWKEVAVLARTNSQVDTVQRFLEDAKIPCHRVAGRDDYYKAPAVRPIIDWMQFLFNRRDNISFKKVLRSFGVTDLKMNSLTLISMQQDCSLYETAFSSGFDEFVHAVSEIDESIETYGIYRPLEMFDLIGKLRSVPKQSVTEKARDAIAVWEKSKYYLGESDGVQAFLKYLRYRDIQEKLIEERDAVKLMTVHASKGLEFDTVFIVGLNQDVFPSKRGDIEEERRLFYVALTRAKNRLYVTYPERAPNWQGSMETVQPSQFLSEMSVCVAGK